MEEDRGTGEGGGRGESGQGVERGGRAWLFPVGGRKEGGTGREEEEEEEDEVEGSEEAERHP